MFEPGGPVLSKVPEVTLIFWIIKIAATTLGATVGDLLDKPVSQGGFALSRPIASAVIAVFIVGCVLLLPQRPGRHPGGGEPAAP
jgi:uncharacterized membrane-anchored protein